MADPLTVEEKAQAFDHLCRMFDHPGRYIGARKIEIRDTSAGSMAPSTPTTSPTYRYKVIQEYEFRLITIDNDNFLSAMTNLVRKQR